MGSLVDEETSPTEVPYEAPDDSPKKGKKKRDASTLRKAPQAPKRFKSSYICFFMAKQTEIKDELGADASVTEVSKRSAEMWRNLPAEERAHWDNVAAKDKQRYMVEKATYTGPWQIPWKRAKKDPSAPKRPMSAFLYFSQEKRRQIKEENPTIKNTEVSRILGELWRNASTEEKKPHVDREKEQREIYKLAIAEWRDEFEKKMDEQRKQQTEQAQYMANAYQTGEQSRDAPPPGHHSQYPPQHPPQYGDPHGYNPYMQHGNAPYGYPPQYPPHMYPPQYPPTQGQYGYANGKHVAVLGPNGMPTYPAYASHTMPPHQGGPSGDSSQEYEGQPGVCTGQYDHGDLPSEEDHDVA